MIDVRQIKYQATFVKKCRYVLLISDTTTITKQPDKSDETDEPDEQIQPSNNEGS